RSALAVAGATALAGGIMLLSAVSAPSAGAEGQQKYFVCKYTTTPGGGEVLQTGNNPISVAIPGGAAVGDQFGDAQDLSLVIGLDNTGPGGGQNGEPAPECPATLPGGGGSSSSTVPPPPPPTTKTVSNPGVTKTITAPGGVVTQVVNNGGGGAPAGQAQGPIPAGVNAGLHTTDSNAGLRAWGILLMLLGGAAGLVFGLRPSRGRAH
ncbi:MAG: hypothetical protein ABR571_18235, partial [Jatrophihabitans sp.]